MKTYSVTAWLKPLIDLTEEHLSLARHMYQPLTNEQLLAPPGAGGWSVAQCLDHLNSYGNYYLPAVEKALARSQMRPPKTSGSYRSGWLGHYFINMMQPGNGKKYKAFKGHIPQTDLDGAAVVAEFIHQQQYWLQLLQQIDHVESLRTRIPISISPLVRLQMGDVLGFVKAHDDRHIQQANRVLKEHRMQGTSTTSHPYFP